MNKLLDIKYIFVDISIVSVFIYKLRFPYQNIWLSFCEYAERWMLWANVNAVFISKRLADLVFGQIDVDFAVRAHFNVFCALISLSSD